MQGTRFLVALALALVCGTAEGLMLSRSRRLGLRQSLRQQAEAAGGSGGDTRDVASLVAARRGLIDALAESTSDVRDADAHDDLWLLRFALANADDAAAAEQQIRETLAWRSGEGKAVVDAAAAAVAAATAGGGWDNEPVLSGAPHADVVTKYITPKQCLTVTTKGDDLCYIIRAATVDDQALMGEAAVDEVVAFFLYAKEVNSIVADARTRRTGRLTTVITANDLSGIDLFGDATFRKALSAASKQGNKVYPALAGPTLLLNLPKLVSALVSVFKPLFPKPVQEKLRFERGPLADVDDLTELSASPAKKEKFLSELEVLLG